MEDNNSLNSGTTTIVVYTSKQEQFLDYGHSHKDVNTKFWNYGTLIFEIGVLRIRYYYTKYIKEQFSACYKHGFVQIGA